MVWGDCLGDGFVAQIESKISSAFLGIGTVASDTVIREYRTDIAIEIDGLRGLA
jgi:hypothetical protein